MSSHPPKRASGGNGECFPPPCPYPVSERADIVRVSASSEQETQMWREYVEFTNIATIGAFRSEFGIPPVELSSYNDLLKIETYTAADLSFADRQRRGIHQLLEDSPSLEAHVARAMKQTFPLAAETPLPAITKKAALLIKKTPASSMIPFWEKQLRRLEQLVSDASAAQARWDRDIPSSLKPAAGKLKTVALKQLFQMTGIGGVAWLDQFAFGFPITGKLSQTSVYPTDPKVPEPKAMAAIFPSAAARFRERAAKSGYKNADKLWSEAMQQVDKGWLHQPVKLDRDGKPENFTGQSYNIAFRFGVPQSSKLRACDDLRHSLTNEACAVTSPIQLVSWDHIAQIFRLVCSDGREWQLFKADHEAAYKQLPIRTLDQTSAIIALRHPTSGLWHGFVSRTLMFGSVAAVLHYNCFARAIATLATLLLGIPLVSYFDDFAALLPADLAQIALDVFTRFCSTLGFQLKPGKSEVGSRVTFLGLLGSFPAKTNSFKLGISLPEEKASHWAALIQEHIKARSISHQQLEKLIGKLSFSQTQLFAKFARTQLRPLYRKLYRKVYNAKLTLLELHNLRWWYDIISAMSPRWVTTRPTRVPWIAYTDAATNPPKICALLFEGTASSPLLSGCWTDDVPRQWVQLFHRTALIFGLELLALVAFFEQAAPDLADQCIWVYVDNNNVLAAISRGDSNTDVIAVLVARLWKTLHKFSICAWFSRVPSKLNPADLPTRGKALPFTPGRTSRFKHLAKLFRLTRDELNRVAPPRRLQVGRIRR